MRKTALIVLGTSLFLSGCTLPVNIPTNTPYPQTQQNQTGKSETLGEIMASAGSAKCTITNLSNRSVIDYLVSGNKYKVIGTDLGDGKKGEMIVDGTNTYTWQDGQKTGFRIPMSPEEMAKNSPEDATRSASSYLDESKYKMECFRYNLTGDEFKPPADIKFLDPGMTAPGIIQNMVTK